MDTEYIKYMIVHSKVQLDVQDEMSKKQGTSTLLSLQGKKLMRFTMLAKICITALYKS